MVCQSLATGRWFSPGTPVSSTSKTDCHDITTILLKVALNTINPILTLYNVKKQTISHCRTVDIVETKANRCPCHTYTDMTDEYKLQAQE